MLTWSVSGATGVNIDGIGAVSGSSVAITPTIDTDYVLTASNQFGSTQMHASVAVYPPPTIWFAPFPPTLWSNGGSVDYTELFSPTAPWSTAAARVQVFKLYPYTLSLPDADLRDLFADLGRRHIAVALEQGGLTAVGNSSCFGDFDGINALQFVQRIRNLGGTLQYIALDEPFLFAVLFNGADACHWTVQQTVDNVAATVARMHTVFPDALVGDIEVIPASLVAGDNTYLDLYQRWVDAWQVTTGQPFAFFHFDVDWTTEWRPAVKALSLALRQRHIAIGQIYIGDGDSPTDADWVALAEQRMTDFETHANPMHDEVIFQSWHQRPRHVLPETDPAAFTYLINRYFRDRTVLASTVSAASMQGGLSTAADGTPVANAPVSVTAVPLFGTGQATTYTRTGSVPAGTQFITFGVRVNDQCPWPNPTDFYITSLSMDAGTIGRLGADFTNELANWGWWGAADVFQVSNSTLHVTTSPGETFGMNRGPFAFATAGAPYTFSVNATIPVGSRGNACAIMVFQTSGQTEVSRESIALQPQPVTLGTALTANDGSFAFALNLAASVDYELWAEFPGSDKLWPAVSSHTVGSAVPVSITTGSLPHGRVGAAYAQTLSAAGGLAPYLWVATGLPQGLLASTTGVLAGFPTSAGTYTVTVDVVDDSMPTQAAVLSLSIVVD